MIAEQEPEEVKVNSVEQIKTLQTVNKVPLESQSLPQPADRSQHPKEVERTTSLLEQPESQEKTSDISSETEVNIMHEEHINDQEDSDTGVVSLVKTDTVSEAVHAAAITESVPPCLHLVSSSPSADSSPILLPRSSPPLPPVECESVNSLLKEDPQYPKSLWDAVNRIRKHTAPDSENEEEEVSELWDPESVGEDVACPGLTLGMHFEKRNKDGQEKGSREGGLDSAESGDIQQFPYDAELLEHAAEDTLSCSSASSHGSEDTVIIADEEVEDMSSNTGTAIKTMNEEEEAKEDQCFPLEVKVGSAAQGEEESRDQYHKTDLGE